MTRREGRARDEAVRRAGDDALGLERDRVGRDVVVHDGIGRGPARLHLELDPADRQVGPRPDQRCRRLLPDLGGRGRHGRGTGDPPLGVEDPHLDHRTGLGERDREVRPVAGLRVGRLADPDRMPRLAGAQEVRRRDGEEAETVGPFRSRDVEGRQVRQQRLVGRDREGPGGAVGEAEESLERFRNPEALARREGPRHGGRRGLSGHRDQADRGDRPASARIRDLEGRREPGTRKAGDLCRAREIGGLCGCESRGPEEQRQGDAKSGSDRHVSGLSKWTAALGRERRGTATTQET